LKRRSRGGEVFDAQGHCCWLFCGSVCVQMVPQHQSRTCQGSSMQVSPASHLSCC
jgi:hypothetical protein